MRSWTLLHPNWTYVFWDDADNRKLVHTAFPAFAALYDGLPGGVARADFARYALLHKYGGVYVDADFEAKAPFDDLVAEHQAIVSSEPQVRRASGRWGGPAV